MKKLIIYDDFYQDPMQLRQIAIDLEYDTLDPDKPANYCGVNSIMSTYTNDMNDFFSYVTGEKVKKAEPSCTGNFRLQKLGDTCKQHIHVDLPNFNCSWAAVWYGSLPEHYGDTKATYFWRHKRLNNEEFPMNTEGAANLGFYKPEDLRDFMYTDGMDESKWDMVSYVPQKFNRLVLFRPNLWHSPGELFGDSKENCRLIQTFFLEPDIG
jgi:hypothetical protein